MRHGDTCSGQFQTRSNPGKATAIAHRLSDAGHLVTTVDAAAQAVDLDQFDAFVIGSAVYMGHWTKDEALKLLSTHTMPSIE